MDTVALNEEEGEETYVDEDHAVELVVGTYKNPHNSKVYRRNTRDRLHVEIDVRTITAEDTMSAMAKLMGTTQESTSGVTDHRRIPATSRGEQYYDFLFWQVVFQKQVEEESLQGKDWIREGIDELDLQTVCRQTASESTKQLGEPPSDP